LSFGFDCLFIPL
jgi:hypothetical protein